MNPGIIEKIVKLAESLQISYGLLFSSSRKPELIRIRYCICFYLLRNNAATFKSLSDYFKKDRATIYYAYEQTAWRVARWSDYNSLYKQLIQIFEGI